jgi:hypothetical protein
MTDKMHESGTRTQAEHERLLDKVFASKPRPNPEQWARIRLPVGPIHMSLDSPHDCRQLLTTLLQRLQEQAPDEADEWVRHDALRLCPVRAVPPVRDTLPSGPPAHDWQSTPRNLHITAPEQGDER